MTEKLIFVLACRIIQPRFESVKNISFFIVFEWSLNIFVKLCQLEFRFKSLPYSVLTERFVPFLGEPEACL